MGKERIKILYIMTHCTKSGPIQQMLNLIRNLDSEVFQAELITIYDEDTNETSLLDEYKKVIPHILVPVSKIDIILGKTRAIEKAIAEFAPDVIHSFGVFPDFMIAKMGFENHVLTSRNYVYDDYPDEYGKVMGTLLAWIHLYAIKHTKYAHCCSESLHNIYKKKLNIDLPFIRNGVDISKFSPASSEEKTLIRKQLNLPIDRKIVVYGGVFNDRKNQEFLLEGVAGKEQFKDYIFLLLGDGAEYPRLNQKYSQYENVLMPGNTTDMSAYLKASDFYISTSKSEGLPNGVLEAMASGIPVFLSDILQHQEVLSVDRRCGMLYSSGDMEEFVDKLNAFLSETNMNVDYATRDCVNNHFTAQIMSKSYQNLYKRIIGEKSQ